MFAFFLQGYELVDELGECCFCNRRPSTFSFRSFYSSFEWTREGLFHTGLRKQLGTSSRGVEHGVPESSITSFRFKSVLCQCRHNKISSGRMVRSSTRMESKSHELKCVVGSFPWVPHFFALLALILVLSHYFWACLEWNLRFFFK